MYQTTTKPPVSKTTTTWHEAVQPTSPRKKNKKIHTKLLKWDSHSHCSIMQLQLSCRHESERCECVLGRHERKLTLCALFVRIKLNQLHTSTSNCDFIPITESTESNVTS